MNKEKILLGMIILWLVLNVISSFVICNEFVKLTEENEKLEQNLKTLRLIAMTQEERRNTTEWKTLTEDSYYGDVVVLSLPYNDTYRDLYVYDLDGTLLFKYYWEGSGTDVRFVRTKV